VALIPSEGATRGLGRYEFETKEGKLIGAAILRAAQQAEEAEQDKMRSLMSASNFAKPSVEPSAFMR
jgi:hypothetical protein